MNLDRELPLHFSRFERVLEIVSRDDEEDRLQARDRFHFTGTAATRSSGTIWPCATRIALATWPRSRRRHSGPDGNRRRGAPAVPEPDPISVPDEAGGPPSPSMFPELDTPAAPSDAHPPADTGAPAWTVEPAHFEPAPALDARLETPLSRRRASNLRASARADRFCRRTRATRCAPAEMPQTESAAPVPAFATTTAYESASVDSHVAVAAPAAWRHATGSRDATRITQRNWKRESSSRSPAWSAWSTSASRPCCQGSSTPPFPASGRPRHDPQGWRARGRSSARCATNSSAAGIRTDRRRHRRAPPRPCGSIRRPAGPPHARPRCAPAHRGCSRPSIDTMRPPAWTAATSLRARVIRA